MRDSSNTGNSRWRPEQNRKQQAEYRNKWFTDIDMQHGRYNKELALYDYPQIRSFLKLVPLRTIYSKEKGTISKEWYEKDHGGGFYTFEII